jgi:hypothetical protein
LTHGSVGVEAIELPTSGVASRIHAGGLWKPPATYRHVSCVRAPHTPSAGTLIILGSCFGAIDDSLTIAAGLTSRNPFMSPFDKRYEADRSRRGFADGTQSDYLAIMHAYQDFDSLPQGERFHFARERFLGIKTLQGIGTLKRQLLELLSSANLAPRGLKASWVEMLGRKNDGVHSGDHRTGRSRHQILGRC